MFRFRYVLLVLLLLTLTSSFAGKCLAQSDVTRIRDVVYGRTNGLAMTMDVLKPAHPQGG